MKINKTLLLCLMFTLGVTACSEVKNDKKTAETKLEHITQASLQRLAKNLTIKYKFLSNVETDCPDLNDKKVAHCYSAEVQLTNNVDLLATNWIINFSQVYVAYTASGKELDLRHVNGDIHQIIPNKNFIGFKANETKTIKLWVKSTLIGESELMPNYWLSAKGLKSAVIESTRTGINAETGLETQPYVVAFDNYDTQVKSAPNDINKHASAQWLYQQYGDVKLQTDHLAGAIIPTPKSIKLHDKNHQLDISQGLTLKLNNIAEKEVIAAKSRLKLLGVGFADNGVVVNVTVNHTATAIPGSYQMSITKQGITIDAADNSGAFYGLQSIAALLTLGTQQLPLVEIDDAPHYQYRGQHLDVARNFHSKEMVFALIKQMAAYKLNKLHLHLAEDEGWRLALPSFPELTELGSKRCMNLSDKSCLQPQLGGADNQSVDGFYSVSDYQEILTMATRHHIQVIPSLDMPGHSRAAVKAMEARYHYYMAQENMPEATRYLLSDFEDKTQYNSIQNYNDNTINICMESAYTFVDQVLEDLIGIHQQAGHPLAMYHIGADETAGAWVESPQCQALLADKTNEVNDVEHLGAHFIERVSHMIASKGIAIGGWNDGLAETDVKRMPDNIYSYIWGALPWGAHNQVSEQANRGWHVVLSIPDVLYFDFPYEIDPKERGYHWASRRVNSRSLFNFMPDNLPIHAEFRVDTLGLPFVSDDRLQQDEDGKITHQPLPKNYIVDGIQGQLWSETVRSDNQAEYMVFPRLLTLAERAWHEPKWQVPYNYLGAKYDQHSAVFTHRAKAQRDRAWQQFSAALTMKELVKLEKANIFYRLPTVGAVIEKGLLKANTSLIGLPIEYRQGTGQWQSYQHPVAVQKPVQIRTRTFDGSRAGRTLTLK